MPSNYLILCRPLLLLPSIFPSIRVSSNESVLCIRWPKYESFIFSISPSNEYSELISFRTDWLDLLAVQETLKSLLQHQSLKGSIIWPFWSVIFPDSLIVPSFYFLLLGWPKCSYRFLCKILCKNLNKHFGQTNFLSTKKKKKTLFSLK